jgi:hypothetical protein
MDGGVLGMVLLLLLPLLLPVPLLLPLLLLLLLLFSSSWWVLAVTTQIRLLTGTAVAHPCPRRGGAGATAEH